MGLSRRVYIALFAVLAELVAIAATGNQGVTNFVADHMATSPLGDLFLRSLPVFPWRVTTEARSGAATILVSQYAAIGTFLVLTFVLLLIVVRGALSFSEPFFAALCVVVSASLVAHMVGEMVDYDQDGRLQHTGLGRFGYAIFNSNNGLSIMFSIMCGLVVAVVVGFVASILRRRAAAEIDQAMVLAATGAYAGSDEPFEPGLAAPWNPGGFTPPENAPAAEVAGSTTAGYGSGYPGNYPAADQSTEGPPTEAFAPVEQPAQAAQAARETDGAPGQFADPAAEPGEPESFESGSFEHATPSPSAERGAAVPPAE